MNEYFYDEKKENRYVLSAEEKDVRREFVRKVVAISLGQFISTVAILLVISYHEPFRNFFNSHPNFTVYSLLMMFGLTMVLICFRQLFEMTIASYALAATLTAFTTFWATCLGVKYSQTWVLISIGIAIIASIVLGIYSMYTSFDFTLLLAVLYAITMIAIVLNVVFFIFQHARLKWAILIGSTILTCAYYLSDVQMIITGDRTFFLDTESHVVGACIMYVDLVYFFVYPLMMLGDSRWTTNMF